MPIDIEIIKEVFPDSHKQLIKCDTLEQAHQLDLVNAILRTLAFRYDNEGINMVEAPELLSDVLAHAANVAEGIFKHVIDQ